MNLKEIEKFMYASKKNNRDLTEVSYAQEMLNNIQKCDLKVLGIPWNKEDDQFKFSVQHLLSSRNADEVTNWKLLRFSAFIFNPFGIISPAVLPLKVMFHKAFCKGKRRDERTKDSDRLELRR